MSPMHSRSSRVIRQHSAAESPVACCMDQTENPARPGCESRGQRSPSGGILLGAEPAVATLLVLAQDRRAGKPSTRPLALPVSISGCPSAQAGRSTGDFMRSHHSYLALRRCSPARPSLYGCEVPGQRYLCAPSAIRTRGLLLRRQLLYPLSYRGWQAHRDPVSLTSLAGNPKTPRCAKRPYTRSESGA